MRLSRLFFVCLAGWLLPLSGCGDPAIPREELGEVIGDLTIIPGVSEPYDFKDLPEPQTGPPSGF